MVKAAAMTGLMSVGRDVVDIGICPTPTVEIAVRDGGFAGGIAVTASHNPDEYNALKLIGPGGLFLSEKRGLKVNDLYKKNKSLKQASWSSTGILSDDPSWIGKHIDKILALDIIKPESIRQKDIRVVVDCVGGTAAYMAGDFFSKIGVSVKLINAEITGRFPHRPEPTPEHLGQLCGAVKAEKADLGLAFDPDSDRLAVVSEKGIPLGEEYTLALCTRFVLGKTPGPVAVNLSTSMMNDFAAREAGVKLYRTKVGERNVTEKLISSKGIIGGEGNGGVIYPALHWGRDGFMAAALLLQYMAESGKTIGTLAGELPDYVMLKRKLKMTRPEVQKKIKAVIRAFPDSKTDLRDGLKIYGHDWWVQIRASNTEPIARLTSEAGDNNIAGRLLNIAGKALKGK